MKRVNAPSMTEENNIFDASVFLTVSTFIGETTKPSICELISFLISDAISNAFGASAIFSLISGTIVTFGVSGGMRAKLFSTIFETAGMLFIFSFLLLYYSVW